MIDTAPESVERIAHAATVVEVVVVVEPVALHPLNVKKHVVIQVWLDVVVVTPEAVLTVGHSTLQSLAVCRLVHDEKVVVVTAVKSQPETVFVEVVQELAACPVRPGAKVVKHPT